MLKCWNVIPSKYIEIYYLNLDLFVRIYNIINYMGLGERKGSSL